MAKIKKKTTKVEKIDIDVVARSLVESHEAKKNYDSCRKNFFNALNEMVLESNLVPEETVETDLGVTEEQVLREMPDYVVIDAVEKDNSIFWRLQQDPSLIPATYIIKDLGMIVGRTVSSGKHQLDLEEMIDEHPEYTDLLSETYTVDGDTVREILAEVPELADKFKLLSRNLDDEKVNEMVRENPHIVNHIEDHTYPCRSTVRITTPRMAKPEELDEV